MKTTLSQSFGPLSLVLVWNLISILTPLGAAATVVTFTNDTVIADTSYDGQDIVVRGCTVTANGLHSFNSVQVLGGGVLTHPATTTNQEYSLQLSIASNLVVDASSAIDVSGRGYLPGYTLPNTTVNGATVWSGGSYGGLGVSAGGGGAANPVYGDYRDPKELGSGNAGDNPGSGGGLARITAGSAHIDGAILANGGPGGNGNSGGGSGGGVRLSVGTLSGSGVVAANGGGGTYGGGSGGGGRVAIYYTTLAGFDITNKVTAHGGNGVSGAGAVGTVYLKQNGGSGELLLASHGTPTGVWTPLGQQTDTVFQADVLVLSGTNVVAAPEHELEIGANSVLITSGAVLTHQSTTPAQEYSLRVTITNGLAIDAGAKIDVSARGYLSGYTLGNTATGATGRSGGSYGGLGSSANGAANPVYGDYRDPKELGSGNAGDNPDSGGGLARITAGSAQIDGAILANGAAGGNGNSGGGSGGGVLLKAGTLSGGGLVAADGGGGTYGGGSGGGGRVAIYYTTLNGFDVANNVTAHGGSGGSGAGAVGTVYLKNNLGMGQLLLANHGNVTGAWTPLGGPTDTVFVADTLVLSGNGMVAATASGCPIQANAVTLINGAVLTHPVTTTNQAYSLQMTIAGNLFVDATSRIDVSGRGYLPWHTFMNSAANGATGWSGGSYGGLGVSAGGGGVANPVYGDYRDPNELGSGSAGDYPASGGGLVRIITGSAQIDGAILANGGSGGNGNNGGGSGGGVRFDVGTLSGSGLVAANGGNGAYGGGSGGGGRVALYYTALNGFDVTNKVTAHGASGGSGAGAVGTVYLKQNGGLGELLLASHGAPTGVWTPLGQQTDTVFQADVLVLSGTNVVAAPEHELEIGANSVLITSGAVLTHQSTTPAQEYSLRVTITNGLAIDAGARIDVSGRGYPRGYTLGNTMANGATGWSGGSYGGLGRSVNGAANPVYGDYRNPDELGSGNAGDNPDSGGGLVRITAGSAQIDGAILANGAAGGNGNSGGGSGGGVLLNVGTLSGEGIVAANGGSGTYGGGGGGGGRVAIYTWNADTLAATNVTANGGIGGGGSGQAGTVVWSTTPAFGWGKLATYLHGTESLSWYALGVDPSTVRADVLAANAGVNYSVSTDTSASASVLWDTTTLPDGIYDLRAVFRNTSSQIIGDISLSVVILNQSVVWHSADVAANETWAAGMVHIVEGKITLQAGVTLAIAPGAIVKFVDGAMLTVADGATLSAAGTADLPVIITAIQDDRAGGDSNLDGNASRPVPGSWSWAVLGAGQTIFNDYTDIRYAHLTHAGLLAASETWAGSQLHEVTGNVTVEGGATLSIGPGAIVKFALGSGLIVQSGGSLNAQGTVAQPIHFTSVRDDSMGGDSNGDGSSTTPAAGDWDAIYISGGQAAFNHVVVSYGAGNDSASTGGLISSIDPASVVVISNSVFSSGLYRGIYATLGQVTVANCIVTGCDRGIQAGLGVGAQMNIVNCTLDDNNLGLVFHGGTVNVANTVVANSLQYGIVDCCGSTIASFRYCDVWTPSGTNYIGMADQTGLNGNLSADPKFVHAAQGDYRLNYGSPCIDAADGTVAPPTDFMGAPRYNDPRTRVKTGLPGANGVYADMGAFEFVESAASDVDLVAVSVLGPSAAAAGDAATVQWTVANTGSGRLTGPWHDTIYLAPEDSAGRALLADEVLVGQGVTLGAGQSVTVSHSVRVPGATEGNYLWRVHVNSKGDIYEGANAANNQTDSQTTLALTVPELALNSPTNLVFAGEGVASWFKVRQSAAQALVVDLQAAMLSGRCRLYAGYNTMPSTSDYDVRSSAWNATAARVSLSAPDTSRTTYLLVMPEKIGTGNLNYTLSARPAVFALSAIGVTTAGNGGWLTLPILGSGFAGDLTVSLQSADGTTLAAATVSVLDATSAEARFDLRGVAPGLFSVTAAVSGSQSTLTNAFRVTIASANGGGLKARLVLPTAVRTGRIFTGYIEYMNTGDSDVPAALVSVSEARSNALLWAPGGSGATNTCVSFLTISPDSANPAVLRPGLTNRLAFQGIVKDSSSATFILSLALANDTAPLDSSALEASVMPAQPHPLWPAAWTKIFSGIGSTWGGYVTALDAALVRAKAYGLSLSTEPEVLRFLIQEAIEQVQVASVGGRVWLGDTNHPLGRVLVLLSKVDASDTDTNTTFATTAWYDGSFGIRDVSPGTYTLSVSGYLPDPILTVNLPDPTNSPATNLTVILTSAAGKVFGYVTEGSTGPAVTNAIVTAIDQADGGTYLAMPDSTGWYAISNLPPGTYEIELDAPAWLPLAARTITLTNGQPQLETFELSGGAEITGVVSTSAGVVVAGATVQAEWVGVSPGYGSWHGGQATTDASGNYTISGLLPGTYGVSAAATNLGCSAVTNVHLADSGTIASVNLQLAKGTRLSGTVVDAGSGAPLAGVFLSLDAEPPFGMTALSDHAGQFAFTNPPAGSCLVSASLAGYMQASLTVSVSQGGSVPLTIALDAQGIIGGYVRSRGAGLANRTVTLVSTNGTFLEVPSNDQGAYGINHIPPGSYSLYYGPIDGPSLFGQSLTITATNLANRYDFNLDTLSLVGGRLYAADKTTVVSNALVSLLSGSNIVAQATTDTNGAYEFEVYQPGVYTLLARAANRLFAPQTNVSVTASNNSLKWDLLEGSGQLGVTVSASAGGGALSNAWVAVHPLADPSGAALGAGDATGADGRTAFASLPPGLYRVTALLDAYAYAEQIVSVSSSPANIAMVLNAGRTVRGSVTAEGSALTNVPVVIAAQGGRPSFTSLTDENGAYAFTSLPAGVFDLAVVPGQGYATVLRQGLDTSVVNDQVQDFALPAADTATLSGLALDESGLRQVPAVVSLVSSNGIILARDVTDLQSGYSLSGWPAGSFVLQAVGQGRLPVLTGVTTVQGASQTNLTLSFSAPVAAAIAAADVALGHANISQKPVQVQPQSGWDLFTGSFWEDVFSGTMGIPDPDNYINNQNIDWNQVSALESQALANGSFNCNGVSDALKAAWRCRYKATGAAAAWRGAYLALKQLNLANVDVAVFRGALVAARIVKLGMSAVMAADSLVIDPNYKGMFGDQPASLRAAQNLLGETSATVSLIQNAVKEGNMAKANVAINSLRLLIADLNAIVPGGVATGPIATLGLDGLSLLLEWKNWENDRKELGEDAAQSVDRYLQAGDACNRCLLNYKKSVNQMKAAMADCKTGDDTKSKSEPVPGHANDTQQVDVPQSRDPNYKVSLGYGASGYVLATEPLLYIIEFENVSNATAAAQQVVVTDPLDPNLDWSTFQLVQISFNHITIDVPPGLIEFSTNVYVSTDPNRVLVTAALDPDTGLATWNMLSIDETTGELVKDPLAGFLPPNDATGSGQGYVTYSIQPKRGLASGAIITNRATIVFDVNAPILTRIATNTLDTRAPTCWVTAQPAGTWDTNLMLSWSGTDTGSGIASYDVYVSTNGGPWTPWLTGTTNVSAVFPANLANTYAFYSLARDYLGNQQPAPSVPDLTLAPLTVSVSGDGSLDPDWRGTGFKQVGSNYTIKAVPGFGCALTGWTGGLTSSANNLTFTMRTGLVLHASFAPIPYAETNGTYYGLFYPTTGVTHQQSGTITLTTTARRKFTGKLQIAGGSCSISGQLDTSGFWSKDNIQRRNQSPLNVQLVMRGTDCLLGSVSTADWTADIIADRAVYDGKRSFAPQMGRYTLVIAGTNGSTLLPAGYGYGTLIVSPAGKTTFAGSLAEGTKISQSAIVGATGQCPFYIPLYGGNGSLLSWLAFNGAQALGGDLAWSKPNLPKSKYYPAQFSWLTPVYGARYYPPGKGTNVLGLTSASLKLTLEGGNLSQTVTSQFTLDAKNQAKDAYGKKVNVTFTPATGLFQGTVANPDAPRKTVSFNGAVLQNQTNGWGFFLGTNQSGEVMLKP